MKIRTAVIAGMTFDQCDQIRNYWKGMAQSGSCYANPPAPPSNISTTTPPPSQPAYPTSGGGYVGGVYYPDKSGIC